MTDLLKGKTVLVTAAAGTGIGFSTARRAAEEGAFVILSDRHERRLNESADQIAELTGSRPPVVACDVTDQAQIDAMIAFAIAQKGHLDVLVNNAGLGMAVDMIDMTDEQWDLVMNVTLTSCMRCMRAVLPHFYERNSGIIVNNASVLGWRAQKAQSAYAAAKAGVMALTRCVAMEAADHKVRINAVAPSLAMHPFLAKVTPPGLLAQLEAQEAFGRGATPDEIANVILFLASDLSSYMTGEVVSVSSQHP